MSGQSYQYTSSILRGPTTPASSGGGQLKSCLRRGNFSSQRLGLVGIDGLGGAGGGARAGSILRPSAYPGQHQHYHYNYQHHQQLRQQTEEQPKQQPQQQPQAREEEECDARSAFSAPSVRSTRSVRTSRSAASAARSAASAPEATTSRSGSGSGSGSKRNSSSGSGSGSSSSVNSKGSSKSGKSKTSGGSGGEEDDERRFMRISKSLVTEHMTGKYSRSDALRGLLHQHLPRHEQRQQYYSSLQRNVTYLPMFPEPNEHPSLALTRYVEKMFGPLLAREIKRLGNGSDVGGLGGTGANGGVEQVTSVTSPTSYGSQRFPQHVQSGNQHTQNGNHSIRTANEGGGAEVPHPTSYGTQRYPQRQPERKSPERLFDGPDTVAGRSWSAKNAVDEPMFAPPSPPGPSNTSNQTVNQYEVVRRVISSTINLRVPPPIPIQHHENVPPPSVYGNGHSFLSLPPIKTTTATFDNEKTILPTQAPPPPPITAPTTAAVHAPITTTVPTPLETRTKVRTINSSKNKQLSRFSFSQSSVGDAPSVASSPATTSYAGSSPATANYAPSASMTVASAPLASRSRPSSRPSLSTIYDETSGVDMSQGKTPRTSNMPGAIRTTTSVSAAVSLMSSPQINAHMAEAKTPRISNLPSAIRTTALSSIGSSQQQSNLPKSIRTTRLQQGGAVSSPTSSQHNVTFSPSAISSVSSAGGAGDEGPPAPMIHSSGKDVISPISVSSNGSYRQSMTSRSLLESSTESGSLAGIQPLYPPAGSEKGAEKTDDSDSNSSSAGAGGVRQYQAFSNKDMLPPMTPREKILYYPDPTLADGEAPKPAPCCDGGPRRGPRSPRDIRLPRRPPEYLQLYVKCERSEPFVNEDMDIVTWYMDNDKRVTADRTLVARGSADMIEFLRGIVECFGLSTPRTDVDVAKGEDDESNSIVEKPEDDMFENLWTDDADDSESLLGCYKDICFVSDVVMTTRGEKTRLSPLPVPGLHYKYVDRPGCGGGDAYDDDDDDDRGIDGGKKKRKKKKRGAPKKSSVLSTDPAGLRRTLVAQLLDKPIHSCNDNAKLRCHEDGEGCRSRLAFVYCAPKRQARVSSRSTLRGLMPETIYHFQILLEGIVAEEDLPSSFQSQASLRCVGATGGVLGGSVVDSGEEVDGLNRRLWKMRRKCDDVVGLATPMATKEENLEQIIRHLGVPLFDLSGNQTPREFVVDRCLYNIYSGKLSMEAARKTRDAVEAAEDAAEWLARRMEELARGIVDGAAACEDAFLAMAFENENLEEFDAVVSRLGIVGEASRSKWTSLG